MRSSLAPGSGGVLPEGDGDVVAERLELTLGVAAFSAAVGVHDVPVGSEVPVAGGGVVQQVSDADQDGPADGATGLLPPAAARAGGEAAEALAEEGVGVRGGVGGQDGDPLGVGVAAALLPAALDGPGLPRRRVSPAQDTSASGVGKRLISRPISAIRAAAASRPSPGISSSRSAAGSTAAPAARTPTPPTSSPPSGSRR